MDLRLPEISAAVQPTVRISAGAKLVAMAQTAMDIVPQIAARPDSIEVIAHVRFAHLTSHMHPMETTNVASTKSAPVTASSTRLSLGCKQAAGQCGSHQERHNMF
jgi:hypothetical protein